MNESNDPAARRALFARPTVVSCIAAACSLLLWAAFDWWQAGPARQFFVDGIPLFAWYALAMLGVAAVLQSRARPKPEFAQVLAWLLCGLPCLLLVFCLGSVFFDRAWYLATLGLAALAAVLYIGRGLRRLTGTRQVPAAVLGVLSLGAAIGVTDSLNVIPDLWTPVEAEPPVASTDTELADEESILFSQAPRIDAALATFDQESAAAPRGFFLGFAGVGDEKVFAQEIHLAARVIAGRWATAGRSLSLINDQRDLDSAPLATVSGLRYALRGIAAHMNLDRDVLFLSISSHGAEDPAIIVANSDMPLNDLTADALADALRDAAIQWRVILISACYAGGFIDALKDPRTIVIAAAAADRTSFGCGTDSDLTYFGEAFYRDALPNARSLREAFETAKAAIRLRERRERVDASRPQAYFGSQIEARLDAMPAHLTAPATP